MLMLCVAVMAWPALHAPTPDAARLRRGRQARLAGIAWAGGDLALVALAAVAVWELHGYSAVAHPDTGLLGIDPVVAVAPALALAGLALIPLRGLPLLARLADRASDRGRRLATALVSWQIARRPIRQAGPALLVVIATATTALATSRVRELASVGRGPGRLRGRRGCAGGFRRRTAAGRHRDDQPGTGGQRRHGGQRHRHQQRGPVNADERQLIGAGGEHGAPGDPAPPRPFARFRSARCGGASPRRGRPGWRCPASRIGWRSSRPSGRPRTAAQPRYAGNSAQSPSWPGSRTPAAGPTRYPRPGSCPPTAGRTPWPSRCPVRGRPATRCG